MDVYRSEPEKTGAFVGKSDLDEHRTPDPES